jgi:plasmid stabilization system protein ParE
LRRLYVAPRAAADIDDLLFQSASRFGEGAADRYRQLVDYALVALLANPKPLATRSLPEMSSALFLYHLRHARNLPPPGARVRSPRHIVAYTFDADTLRVLRLLHDSMDVAAELEEGGAD